MATFTLLHVCSNHDRTPNSVTALSRDEWCEWKHGSFEGISESLDADPDKSKPLYIWQLYSVLGPERIEELVRIFYIEVWNDHKHVSIP